MDLRTITLVALAAGGLGACDTGDDPGSASEGQAVEPTAQEIRAARATALQTLPGDLQHLAPYLTEETSSVRQPVASTPSQMSEVVRVQQPLFGGWSCWGWYGHPLWWQGVAALEYLRASGDITNETQCRQIIGSTSAVSAFTAAVGKEPYSWILSVLVYTGGNCACSRVF